MKITIVNNDAHAIRVRFARPTVLPGNPSNEDTADQYIGFDEVDMAPGESKEFTHSILDVFSLDPALTIPSPRGAGPGDD